MGNRKRNSATARKEMRKSQYFAILKNVPTSPRKMRLVADMIRGLNVTTAMGILQTSPKHASKPMSKLLRSAMANWEAKNEGSRIEESDLYVSQVNVDSARQLKRIRPAPQGRAHRIRKRSNHVTLFVAQRAQMEAEIETTENTSN